MSYSTLSRQELLEALTQAILMTVPTVKEALREELQFDEDLQLSVDDPRFKTILRYITNHVSQEHGPSDLDSDDLYDQFSDLPPHQQTIGALIDLIQESYDLG